MKALRPVAVVLLGAACSFANADEWTFGSASIRPFARVHVDAGAWRVAASDEDTELRRARVGASGRIGDAFRYRVELDAIDAEFDPVDFWLQWRGDGQPGRLTFGHQQVAIGLDAMRGSERLFFMERALPTALVPGYRMGLQWQQTLGRRSGLSVGLFGDRVPSFSEIDASLRGERSVNARLTERLRLPGGYRLHLGVAVDHRRPDDGTARYRARPETRLGTLRFVDTRTIENVDTMTALGLETALIGERVALSAEHINTFVRRDGTGSLDLHGWSGSVVWTSEDGSWRYDRRRGRLTGRPGTGAWSIGVRVSDLDLRSREITGGRERNLTLSAATRVNDWLRLVAEAGHASGRDRNGDPFEFDRLQLRAQFYFR